MKALNRKLSFEHLSVLFLTMCFRMIFLWCRFCLWISMISTIFLSAYVLTSRADVPCNLLSWVKLNWHYEIRWKQLMERNGGSSYEQCLSLCIFVFLRPDLSPWQIQMDAYCTMPLNNTRPNLEVMLKRLFQQ